MEDYQAGRKGPANPMTAGTGSLFGSATATSSATTGLFGSNAANTGFPFGQNKSNFGAPGFFHTYMYTLLKSVFIAAREHMFAKPLYVMSTSHSGH